MQLTLQGIEFVQKQVAEKEFLELTKDMGELLKIKGMKKAASHHNQELLYIQGLARITSRRKGIISVDDVREAAGHEGHPWGLQNATGSIFKGKDWVFMGFAKSKRPAAHSRIVRTWRVRT